jgi:hypothetical protein
MLNPFNAEIIMSISGLYVLQMSLEEIIATYETFIDRERLVYMNLS